MSEWIRCWCGDSGDTGRARLEQPPGPWPDNGATVLICCWPWNDGEKPHTSMATFYWEGANAWRPTFRWNDGDKVKPMPYAWMKLPEPIEVPKS